jgi:hypothetical protein
MSFRLIVSDWAAHEFAMTGLVPHGYAALRRWSGAMFAVYMELTYFALVAYGIAWRRSGMAPAWSGRASLAIGVVGAALFPMPVVGAAFAPPFIPHLVATFLGLGLLRRGPAMKRRIGTLTAG